MDSDATLKTPHAVRPFQVKVLGGAFHVNEVLLAEGESDEQPIAAITTTPEDRWFVMVSDESMDQKDALAIIDDDMSFQVLAYGILKQE